MSAATADRIAARWNFRAALFERRGATPEYAAEMAELLVLRDAEGDDRRMCFECNGLTDKGRCLPARTVGVAGAGPDLSPMKDILQRCERFEWKKP